MSAGTNPFAELSDFVAVPRVAARPGGYMANWMAGHTDRFKAIVSHAGLWMLDQMFGTTDQPMFWRPQFGEPGERPALL